MLLGLWSSPSLAQVETYLVGRGGLSWADQAQEQTGAVENNGSLQPLELISDQNLIQLLRNSGLSWLNGQPDDFTAVGQPRAWSNDGLFDQLDGPLRLIDGDENSSSEGVFKTIRSQAGTSFLWERPFP